MPKENNKMQVDIDTLKKQNVNDLLSIKELYKRIEELGEKITQVKYIDNTLIKKIKKEYGNFKKIILDENVQVKLTNDIKTINSQLTNEIVNTNALFRLVNDSINIDINNISTFKNAITNNLLKITFWGDSITEGWDYITDNMLYYNIYVNEIKKAFPTVNIIVNNRGIGGAMIENAIDDNYISGTNFTKTWSTETGKSWKQYVKDTAPDLLFVAFGMNAQNNDTLGSNAVKSLIDFVNSFEKKPTIIFLTNFLPRESWIATTSTGAYSKRIEAQRYTRNIVSDYTKDINTDNITTISTKDKTYNVTLFDIGDVYNKLYLGYSDLKTSVKAYRNGVDFNHPELLVKSTEYNLLSNSYNFELRCKLNYSNSTNNTFGVTCRNGLTILINSNGSIGIYKGSTLLRQRTRKPFMSTDLKIKVIDDLIEIWFGDYIQLRHYSNDCVANGRIYMAIDGAKIAVNNLIVINHEPIKGKSVITEDFACGDYSNKTIETKYPYGGNGVNHPTSNLVELLYTPFIKKFINIIKTNF